MVRYFLVAGSLMIGATLALAQNQLNLEQIEQVIEAMREMDVLYSGRPGGSKLKMEHDIDNLQLEYEPSGKDHSYRLRDVRQEVHVESSTTGFFASSLIEQGDFSAVRKIFGPGIQGQVRLLEEQDRLVAAFIFTQTGRDDLGSSKRLQVNLEYEVVFIEGSWSGYLAGETVRLALADGDVKGIARAYLARAVSITGAEGLAEAMRRPALGVVFFNRLFKVDAVDEDRELSPGESREFLITANRDHLTLSSRGQRVVVTISFKTGEE